MAEDFRETVMLALNAKFPILKRLFSIRRIGIFGELARGDPPSDRSLDIEVEFEPNGDTYRNFIGLSYYLDELLGRQVSLINRRLAEDFISEDTDAEDTGRKRDRVGITRIRQEVLFLRSQVKNHDLRTFSRDELFRRAALRSLEVIGECAILISPEFKKKHPEIPWTELAGLRLRLIHPFFGPDWVLVWDVLISEMPRIDALVMNISASL